MHTRPRSTWSGSKHRLAVSFSDGLWELLEELSCTVVGSGEGFVARSDTSTIAMPLLGTIIGTVLSQTAKVE